MGEKWNSGVLRIISDVLEIPEITSTIGMEPTREYKKGEPISARNPNSKLRKESIWLLDSGLESAEPLESHILQLIEFVETHKSKLELLSDQCIMEMVCAFSSENGQGGIVLNADLCRRIGDAGLDVLISLYPPEQTGLPADMHEQ